MDTECRQMIINPAYEQAYSAWYTAQSAYDAASSSTMSSANNWSALNTAKCNLNNAKSKLDSTPQYITSELRVNL